MLDHGDRLDAPYRSCDHRRTAGVLGLAAADGEKAMLRLEASGAVLRGQFTDSARARRSGATGGCWRAFTG